MADRQDIDALLIGALYGELEGEERERLEAHLASHPGDRAALDAMESTRAMFREANLATALGSAEPAPAISAKLLQEAARRAPAVKAAAGGGLLSWLSGLFRPFAAHPALSAAAALALVGGAAGVMYSQGQFRTSQPEARRPATALPEASTTAGTAVDTAAPAPAPDPVATTGTAAGTGYPVALDEAQLKSELLRQEAAAAPTTAIRDREQGDGLAAKDSAKKRAPSETAGFERERATRPAPKGGTGYLEVTKNTGEDLAVRDLDDTFADGEAEGTTGGGGGAPAGVAVGGATRAPAAPAAPPPVSKPAAIAADPGAAPRYDARADAALTTWARDRHAYMVKLVTAGKCTEAGQVGADIARRAPEYYQASVANDRAVRNCIQYVDRARRAKQQEEAKSRAAQPRSSTDRTESPAPADTSR